MVKLHKSVLCITNPGALVSHLVVCGLQFLPQLSLVQIQLLIALADPLKLALHLLNLLILLFDLGLSGFNDLLQLTDLVVQHKLELLQLLVLLLQVVDSLFLITTYIRRTGKVSEVCPLFSRS